jgi:hypothetical protein
MPDNINESLEKINAVNLKTWSPPKIKHLTDISETEAGGFIPSGDLVFGVS